MIYFCADDYGISNHSNNRIEKCFQKGVLNKVSVLPNGQIDGLKNLLDSDFKLSLHINLVEGFALSNQKDVDLITTKDGRFKYSFIGLLLTSVFGKRKKLKNQLYNEISKQIAFWKKHIGEDTPLLIDSHQHTHMIPLVFKTLLKVISDEKIAVEGLRVPAEPLAPYILTPSLYFKYSPVGLIKQWLLKFLNLFNKKRLKNSKIPSQYFMGILFSGQMTEDKIKKILPRYLKLSNKRGKDIELTFHPGYLENGETPFEGVRAGFEKFYYSPWRKKEYDSLINFKF